MKKKQRWIAALLALVLLLTAGCGKAPSKDKDDTDEPRGSSTRPAEPVSAEASLDALRKKTARSSEVFAVAYLGYHFSQDPEIPVDPMEVLAEYASQLCEDLPFLTQIPAERIIGEGGDLFCIVPLDEDATVAVSKGYWDDGNGQGIYDDMLYSSASGEPILIFCNDAGWEPDTQVYISGPSGEIFWYAQPDMDGYADQTEASFHDFSPYAELLTAEHRWLQECGWVLPTPDQLIGTSWSWSRYLADGTEHTCEMSIDNDFLAAYWYDGEEHEYLDADWELTYEDGIAVLSIDFGAMAGVLRYDLLYHEEYGELYVSPDVLQKDFPTGGEPMSRYMTKTSVPDPIDMVGTWELGWTEVEGDVNGAEPGSQIIEITTDYEGHYQINYINGESPDQSFYYKDLAIVYDSLYYGCENDQWHATIDHLGHGGMEYYLTLLPDGTLLLRNYWEFEGFRSVAHGWYTRMGGEDPYSYAVSQGWQPPEVWELTDTGWNSGLGYAMDLMDNSDPDDDGGWAILYDMAPGGALTVSHTGSWQYRDGMLYLSLTPAGDGYPVDDSFPVLMLDGELWIGRNGSGLGLPHFYADTLADVLVRPAG